MTDDDVKITWSKAGEFPVQKNDMTAEHYPEHSDTEKFISQINLQF